MRRTGKKYIRKAHCNGISWQKIEQGWRDREVGTGSGECEVIQADDWFRVRRE